MLLILSPHLTLVLPGLMSFGLGFALSFISLFRPTGIAIGSVQWLPVFLAPLLMILGAQLVLLGGVASHRVGFVPSWLERRLLLLNEPRAVDTLLARFALISLVGLLADVILVTLWITNNSGPALLGPAGAAQAAIVIGFSGIATVLSADFAREAVLS